MRLVRITYNQTGYYVYEYFQELEHEMMIGHYKSYKDALAAKIKAEHSVIS